MNQLLCLPILLSGLCSVDGLEASPSILLPFHPPTLQEPVAPDRGTFMDPRDGETYRWVRIGGQVWMAENLRFDVGEGSTCWNRDESTSRERGRYYNWEAARRAVPPGWHLPTDGEWKELEVSIGLPRDQVDETGGRGIGPHGPAGLLKAPGAWEEEHQGRPVSIPGTTGFRALPFGVFALEEFSHQGYAAWWSGTEAGDRAWIRVLRFFDNGIDRLINDKVHHFSVRCIRDETPVSPQSQEVLLGAAGHILFVSDREGAWDIYSVRPDGSDLVRLTSDSGMNSGPELSPDGRKIVFSSNRSGSPEIWVMNADGSTPRQLTHGPGRSSGATWLPDGKRIGFHSTRDGGGIFTMALDGSDVRRITPPGRGGANPSWSPDGSRLAFEVQGPGHHSEIWVMDTDGSAAIQITDTPTGGNQHPQWSPDGQWIVFNSWRNEEQTSSDIWIMRPDGTEQRRLTDSPAMEEYPKWSPDGARILFTVGNAILSTMAADGSDRERISEEHFFTAGEDWGVG